MVLEATKRCLESNHMNLLHEISCLVSYGILCRCGSFSNKTAYEEIYKYCHG